MYEIHESVFNICFDKYVESGTQVKFALRKSNRFDRLLHGHWFYGNENYAAISFWSGSDWKNKTPNIFFGVDKNGYTFLELTASDSDKKKSFFTEILSSKISGLEPFRNGWKKNYPEFGNDYPKSLESFLFAEKNLIDFWIKTVADKFFSEEDNTFNRIGFIEDGDFEKRLENIFQYRNSFNPKNIRKRIPEHLKSFHLKLSFPKIDISIENLPSNAQWIFFTGMNGTGKTNILRGIAAAIVNNFDNHYLINDPTFKTEIKVALNNIKKSRTVSLIEQSNKPLRRLTKGFATYGASRISVMDFSEEMEVNTNEVLRRSSATYSLFHTDGFLFSIDPIFLNYVKNPILAELQKNGSEVLTRFIDQIIDLLPDIIPNLVSIKMPRNNAAIDVWSLIEFVEVDEFEEELPQVEFENLSSGTKSLIAMFGDMLLRLISQQPKVEDFSELTGIVLIDEIDVHLHPINQRLIVEKLTGIFPKIQFIVTTHSPIPLLGAPKGSVFYNVGRSAKHGITIKRLEQLEKEIGNLLPNTIYTSDLFDLESIISVQNEVSEELDTSDNYKEYDLDNQLSKQIGRLKRNSDDDFLKFILNEKIG